MHHNQPRCIHAKLPERARSSFANAHLCGHCVSTTSKQGKGNTLAFTMASAGGAGEDTPPDDTFLGVPVTPSPAGATASDAAELSSLTESAVRFLTSIPPPVVLGGTGVLLIGGFGFGYHAEMSKLKEGGSRGRRGPPLKMSLAQSRGFALRTLIAGTALTGGGAAALMMGTSYLLGVGSIREFSQKLMEIMPKNPVGPNRVESAAPAPAAVPGAEARATEGEAA